MNRLIIDISSILRALHHVGTDPEHYVVEFEGKKHKINSAEHAYENFMESFRETLNRLGLQPFQTIIVKDGKDSRQLRRAIYADYKGKRPKSPPELNREFFAALDGVVDEVLCLGGMSVYQNGMEADDVAAYLALNLQGHKTLWTRDADFLALMSTDIDVLLKNELNPWIHHACPPHYVQVYKALVGDTSDNFPGAKGFGEKAFENFVITFGMEGLAMMKELIEGRRLHELQEDVAEFKPLQKVIDNARDVYLSYTLASFYPDRITDMQIEMKVGQVTHPLFEDVAQHQILVTADNQEALGPQIIKDIQEAQWVSLDLETDTYPESVEWVKAIQENVRKDAMRVDVIGSVPVGVSITAGKNHHKTYYFSFEHAETANVGMNVWLRVLVDELQSKQVVCHNTSGFELPVVFRNTGLWLPNVHCSKILASYVDENKPTGLKDCSKRWLDYDQVSYEEVTQGRTMSELTGAEVLQYGCDDAVTTSMIYLRSKLVTELEHTWDVFTQVDVDSNYLTADAIAKGFPVDLEVLEELRTADSIKFDANLARVNELLIELGWPGSNFEPLTDLSPAEVKRGYKMLTGEDLKTGVRKLEKLAEACGGEYGEVLISDSVELVNDFLQNNFTPAPRFNPKSTKDVTELLYDFLGCPVRYYNDLTDKQRAEGQKLGNPSSDNDCLKWAAQVDLNGEAAELVNLIIDCRAILTRDSLYFSKYKWFVHWDTGHIHSNLKQSSTTSRRFAPSAINCNQIPKRSEEGKQIRKCVIPHRSDAVIVSPDISGQELRLAAWASQDRNFMDCYVPGKDKDLHSLTGARIYSRRHTQVAYEEFLALLKSKLSEAIKCRSDGKNCNFLAQFGGQAFTLGKKLIVPEETAQMFLDARAEALQEYIAWAEQETRAIQSRGYSLTMMGARKHVAELLTNGFGVNHALRSGLNFRIQGSAAEMTKMAMARVWRSNILDRHQARFYFPVHDELVFSVPLYRLTSFCFELEPLITHKYADMELPIVSELGIGPNFCDLEDLPWPKSESDSEFEAKIKEIVK